MSALTDDSDRIGQQAEIDAEVAASVEFRVRHDASERCEAGLDRAVTPFRISVGVTWTNELGWRTSGIGWPTCGTGSPIGARSMPNSPPICDHPGAARGTLSIAGQVLDVSRTFPQGVSTVDV